MVPFLPPLPEEEELANQNSTWTFISPEEDYFMPTIHAKRDEQHRGRLWKSVESYEAKEAARKAEEAKRIAMEADAKEMEELQRQAREQAAAQAREVVEKDKSRSPPGSACRAWPRSTMSPPRWRKTRAAARC